MNMWKFGIGLVLIFACEFVHAETWSCTVEESKAVSKTGKFGESTMSPATVPAFQTFQVSIGDELYVKGGPFNLPDEMKWISLSKGDPKYNGITLLGVGENSARMRYVLVNMQLYQPGMTKPFFATDGGGWLLYSGLCRQL